MRRRFPSLTVAMIAGCFAMSGSAVRAEDAQAPDDAAATVRNALPLPGFAEAWAVADEIGEYDAGSLFKYINGEADLYYPYGFQRAASALYQRRDDPSVSIDAGVFRMGSALDAFGIYSNYRSGSAEPADVGAEGNVSDQQLVFHQDTYFVRLTAVGSADEPRAALLACAKAIAARLPASDGPLEELALIQAEGVDTRTAVYIAESLLGFAFLPRGLLADADVDCGERARVFVSIGASDDEGRASLAEYKAYLEGRGVSPEPAASVDGAMRAQDPLQGTVLVRQQGRYVYGVAGVEDLDCGERVLAALDASVSAQLKGESAPAAPYRETQSVIYGEAGGAGLLMDVFLPVNAEGPGAGLGIVCVASAGWNSDRPSVEIYRTLGTFDAFCSQGYAVFAVRPGSTPFFTVGELLDHVRTGIRYVKAHAAEFSVDPDRLALFGISAGGHLSCLAATCAQPGDPAAADPLLQRSTEVKAVVAVCPPTDFVDWGAEGGIATLIGDIVVRREGDRELAPEQLTEALKAVSPVYHVRPELPPFWVIHGDADSVVPFGHAEKLVNALRGAGNEVEFTVRPGADHSWPTMRDDFGLAGKWLADVLK